MSRRAAPLWSSLLGVGLACALAACQKQAPASPPAEAPPAAPAPVAAAAPAPAPAATGGDPCPAFCERTKALGCKHQDGCVAACRDMRSAPSCTAEMAAVMACFAREPLAHWECNEQGEAAIKDGYCNAEQGKFVACASPTR